MSIVQVVKFYIFNTDQYVKFTHKYKKHLIIFILIK